MSKPAPIPRIVGHPVPETGRVGAVGVGVGTPERTGVGVGVDDPQRQSDSVGQDGFLQNPSLQNSPLPQL